MQNFEVNVGGKETYWIFIYIFIYISLEVFKYMLKATINTSHCLVHTLELSAKGIYFESQ